MSSLEISKKLNASREQLFKAWTDPGELKKWWSPLGKKLVSVENDLREGGTLQYRFEADQLLIDGKYEKVQGHDLLEYTWRWHLPSEPFNDAAYKLAVRFEGDEKTAVLHITQTGFENEEHLHPHRNGWEQALNQLEDYIAGNLQKESMDFASAEKQKPPISGYNETPEQQKVGGG